ncbi:uncharacterized protein LOC131307901 isoform X1 [Rhododendron vialii]|uniref:uncharacterized protein LOC131307901 isoform X1 n=1 Tax=Rhododendron vialii TaxID=182163 RepID=UPI00265F7B61|nr:uncharacterized protein LOC131307901 isoform X1 [Rhododendron vialii]
MVFIFLFCRLMELGGEMLKGFCWTTQVGYLLVLLLWHILHFIVSIWYFALSTAQVLESYLISSGLLKRYKALNFDTLKYLAIVVDSEEAHQISKVTELLQWLAIAGVKNVCLYDTEGLLKSSKKVILERLSVARVHAEVIADVPLCNPKRITVEFASYSDGKEAVAKAANLLFAKYISDGDQKDQIFTESRLTEALKAVGCGSPDPDLLLVYGPARCHMGFSSCRIRYTEIIHMGPLKSVKHGSLIKAIRKFMMVRQNYGK